MSSVGNSIVSLTVKSPAFGAASQAMGELAVAGCIGATCVTQNYLTADTIKALSRVSYTILLPMFLGTNIMKSSRDISKSNLVVPLIAIFQSLVLHFLSTKLILPLFGIDPDSDTGKTTAVTISFGNAGTLPFMFAEALFRTNTEMLHSAYSLISFFSVGWSPFFWSFGRHVLVGDESKTGEIGFKQKIKRMLPPPVMGIMLGFIISLTSLSNLLLSNTEKKAPLSVIFNSFQNLGRAANPLALLVLTSSLAIGVQNTKHNQGTSRKEIKTNTDSKSVTFLQKWGSVTIGRFIISPLVMLIILKGVLRLNIIGGYKVEPMLWFILLLQSAMPPAQNSVLILQVADRAQEASEMAKFLFSVYATSMIPIVIIITVLMQKLRMTQYYY